MPLAASPPVFDGMFRRYAVVDRQGIASVHTTERAGPISRMADVGGVPRELRLSPDGRSLAIVLPEGLQVPKVDGGGLVWKLSGEGQAEFAADSHRLAVGLRTARWLWRTLRRVVRSHVSRSGSNRCRWRCGPTESNWRSPTNPATSGSNLDVEPPRKVADLGPGKRGPVAAPGWSPDGSRLGIGLVLGAIAEIWDVAHRREVVTLEGHLRSRSTC